MRESNHWGGYRNEARPARRVSTLSLVALLLIGAAVFFFPIAAAFAQEAPGHVGVRPLIDELMPYVIEAILAGFFALATWLAMILKKKWGIDIEAGVKAIEARHREALHSAIYSAVAALRQKSGVDNLSFNAGSEDVAQILRYLRDSVPDALAYFAPTPEVVAKIASAKAVEVAAKANAAAPK